MDADVPLRGGKGVRLWFQQVKLGVVSTNVENISQVAQCAKSRWKCYWNYFNIIFTCQS